MPSKSGESGYNMVMLIVAVTILNIMVAAVLPLMSTDIQRQKEEELVFRGFQYAEAIRLFHSRFQRYPVKLEELLEMKPRPDGVFCYNDPVAIGAIKAISEAGLRIPHDIAVVGAGNVHYSDMLAVPLTTVDQCTGQIGKQAAELLMEQIGAKRKPRIKKILITPKLVVRQSTQR